MARLYEILNNKPVPYWLRNGLTAGVGTLVPTSEVFRVCKVRRIGRGYLWPAQCDGEGRTLVLFPECDRDDFALVIVGGEVVETSGDFVARGIIQLLPGGWIKIHGRLYGWDGRDLRRI